MPFASSDKTTRRRSPRQAAARQENPSQPRILSDEEKRQLILAHAAQRQPMDHLQAFSLWAGVIICAAAIGVGWLYSVRQSMADAFPQAQQSLDNAGQAVDDAAWQRYQLQQKFRTQADSMIQQVEQAEQAQPNGSLDALVTNALRAVSSTAQKVETASSSVKASPSQPKNR